MRREKNEGGGESIRLGPGDRLVEVPPPHRGLITPAIRAALDDPPRYFRQIADRCPFDKMAAWLRALLAEGEWDLQLHQGYPAEWTSAGFLWASDTVRAAVITPSHGRPRPGLPPALRRYYSLVGAIDWMGFGCAGGLEGAGPHTPLTAFPYACHGADVDPNATFVFGFSPCGDMLIYTADDRGGWLGHESGQIHLLGTIEQTLEWVYAELLANRGPGFDYRRW